MVQESTRLGLPQQEPVDAAAVEHVERTEQIAESAATTAPVHTVSEHRSVAYDSVPPQRTLGEPFPPPSVMLGQDPRPFWGRSPGGAAMLAIVATVIGVAVLGFLLVARGNQPAQTTPLAPIATSAA